ncbi:hypothetical protein GGR52DRAFT_427813 [Hypoxylon sp. FL1284]|nr:hypothetical protein GGR52DRAFT_427813 [Hypoxylon sp. FL1284]
MFACRKPMSLILPMRWFMIELRLASSHTRLKSILCPLFCLGTKLSLLLYIGEMEVDGLQSVHLFSKRRGSRIKCASLKPQVVFLFFSPAFLFYRAFIKATRPRGRCLFTSFRHTATHIEVWHVQKDDENRPLDDGLLSLSRVTRIEWCAR